MTAAASPDDQAPVNEVDRQAAELAEPPLRVRDDAIARAARRALALDD